MNAAQRLLGLKPSVIREMTRLAQQFDAVNMAQGFPEFSPPASVLEAATAAILGGQNQYSITWGAPALRRALAAKYHRLYDLPVDPETDVTVACGVTEAIIAALLALVNPGDAVVVLEPAHENYLPGISWSGGRPVWVAMRPPDFALDEAALRAAFSQRPRAIILNSPQNPSGRVLTRGELGLIADLCRRHDTIAITDEIYEHILYDGRAHVPLATLPGMAERTVTISGLGKTYAATGWRIGWIVAPPELSAAVRTVHDYLTICAPTPLQAAAAVAVELDRSFYTELAARYDQCRATMLSILAEAGFVARPPEGAYYILADFSPIRPDLDDVSFTRWLTETRQVAVVPGSSFYHDPALGQRYVRFAFPKRQETLELARQRLRRIAIGSE